MKRSKMIKILDAHFNEVCYQDYTPDSKLVLDVLEKAGMLPPSACKREDCECGNTSYSNFEWDRE